MNFRQKEVWKRIDSLITYGIGIGLLFSTLIISIKAILLSLEMGLYAETLVFIYGWGILAGISLAVISIMLFQVVVLSIKKTEEMKIESKEEINPSA